MEQPVTFFRLKCKGKTISYTQSKSQFDLFYFMIYFYVCVEERFSTLLPDQQPSENLRRTFFYKKQSKFLFFFIFEARNVPSWRKNIRNFLNLGLEGFFLQNIRKTFFLEQYKKFFKSGFFYFLSFSWKVSQVAL